MSNVKRVLYVQPDLFFCFSPQISTEPFVRFSNYLNSMKNELNGTILEEYLDLRQGFENLPEYCPENIERYRETLKVLLSNIFKRFRFDICAISAYSDFAYLNSVEVASMIKYCINPSCFIVVGGVHASIFPEDFFPENIPSYFDIYYQKHSSSPIDFIILDEGIKPFFHFVQSILTGELKNRRDISDNPIILKREFLDDLNEIPTLNLDLLKKYQKVIHRVGNFYIRFNSGCSFNCAFCLPSQDYTISSKIVKYRSIDKCMADIRAIMNTDWLKIRQLHIVDSMFFPKRSVRERFFDDLYKISHKINFSINVFDRIETCTLKDLDHFKALNIICGIGLESVSKKLLIRMGKIPGKNPIQISKRTQSYLDKTIELIKYANEIDLDLVFFFMLGIPGTSKETINERWAFLFEDNDECESLMKKYKINLEFFIFALFSGNKIYNQGEEMFGAKYYYKKWWKIFDKDQAGYSVILKPSKNLSFPQLCASSMDFIKNVFKAQLKLKNHFYSLPRLAVYKKYFMTTVRPYEEALKAEGKKNFIFT